MNEHEYNDWRKTMIYLLMKRGYAGFEAEKVMKWWDGIKGKYEVELVGEDNFNKIRAIIDAMQPYNSFDSWTIRVLFYAPFILKENTND
jgi:hypothetical protein